MSLVESKPAVNGLLIDGDLKRLDIAQLATVEECATVMLALDQIIGDIQDQLDHAAMMFNEGGEPADPHWLLSAKRALKGAKTKRAAAQERRGILARATKQARRETSDARFVRAAKSLLEPEMFKRIVEASQFESQGQQP